jgi:hypothetical protein
LLPWPALLIPLLSGCGPAILSPPDASQADRSGVVPVNVELGDTLARDQLRVVLQTGIDGPAAAEQDLTAVVTITGSRLTHTLGPGDLVPGRHGLQVVIDSDRDGTPELVLESVFSWEPDVDDASADRCDVLDPRLCLYPWPNDHFTREDPTTDTGRRLAVVRESMPDNLFGVHVDPSVPNESDGFSIGNTLLAHVLGVDLGRSGAAPITDIPRSLREESAPIVVIDAETGERVPIWAEIDDDVHVAPPPDPPNPPVPPDPADRALIVRRGVNFRDGHRYLVAMRGLVDAAGQPIPPSRGFLLYRDAIPTYIPAVEDRREHMEDVFLRLAEAGVAREDLYLAWDFTVQSTRSLSERLLHMRDESFAGLDGAAPTFTVTSVVDKTEQEDARVLREVFGTYDVPQYLTGDGSPGSRLTRGPDGLPFQNGIFTALFRCTIPRWVLDPDGGVRAARASLYGHGLFGTENEVGSSHVDAMADEQGFVFCATRWVGMGDDDELPAFGIILDFSNFPQLPERLHQGQLNQLFLARLLKHELGFLADPAFRLDDGEGGTTPVFDNSEIFYDGNSQGGIQSGALAAFSQDITRFVMGVPGMNYSTLLKRSVDFDPFNDLLGGVYKEPLERVLLLSISEIMWERVEANGHVYHLVEDTYPGTPPKKLLFHVAFADHQVSQWTAEIWARSMGARAGLPPVNHPDQEPLWGIDPVQEYPFDGSVLVYWDAGNPPPPTSNVPPRGNSPGLAGCAARRGGDPHECPRREPEARLQKSLFLQTEGAVFDTCGGLPCTVENDD